MPRITDSTPYHTRPSFRARARGYHARPECVARGPSPRSPILGHAQSELVQFTVVLALSLRVVFP